MEEKIKCLFRKYCFYKKVVSQSQGSLSLTGLTHNLLIKIGALVLAIGLWFYVAGEETIEADFKIPIQLMLANGLVVTEQDAKDIDVTIKGRKEIISKLASDELVSKIDLTNYKEAQTLTFPIEHKFLPFSPEIKILETNPERLKVKIDRLVQKVMPVRVVTFGEPAPGYKVEGFVIDPISALIKGPEEYLKDMIYIDTEPVDITGRQKSFKKMAPLVSIPMVGEKSQPQFIEVVVKIIENPKSQISTHK